MSWGLYCEDPDEQEQAYPSSFTSTRIPEVNESEFVLGTPDMGHVNFELIDPVPSRVHHIGSAPTGFEFSAHRRQFTREIREPTFYVVSFHANHKETMFSKENFNVGDYVITDADRGVDIGTIVKRADRPGPKETKEILRKASDAEIREVDNKHQREREAFEICREKVREMGLAMEITGAEFQFDGKKLTFYYTASKYIDFRGLVRTLFKMFGTRIWMVWYDGHAPVKDVLTR